MATKKSTKVSIPEPVEAPVEASSEEASAKRGRAPNRTFDQRIAELDQTIAYHSQHLERLQAERQVLLDRAEGRLPSRKPRPLAEATQELFDKFKGLSPDEVEALRLKAQREATVLARLAKESKSASAS